MSAPASFVRLPRAVRVPAAILVFSSSVSMAADPHPSSREGRHLEEVVVTATPLERSSDEIVAPVSIVDRDHLLNHLGTTLGETLSAEPGITASSFAPGASRPIVRGQDTFRVRILEDGIGTHDASTLSADHGVPLHPHGAERIEVVRGPAALRYGGGAIAGVVNAITGRVPHVLAPEPISGEIYIGTASESDARDLAARLGGSAGRIGWVVDATRRRSEDYQIPGSGRKQEFTDTDGWSLGTGLAWIGEDGRVGAAVRRFVDEYGIPAPSDPSDPPRIELDSLRYQLEADWKASTLGIESVRLRAAYTDYEHDEVVASGVASRFENDEWEGRAEILHEPMLGLRGAVGLHVQRRELEALGEASELLSPSKSRSAGLYLFEELPLSDRLRLELGGRVEAARVEGTPADDRRRRRSFTPLSASAGIVLRATDRISTSVTVSTTQRALDSLELFARGPHEADGTFVIGDPRLDEETARSIDWSIRAEGNRFDFEASLFVTRYTDFTYGRLTGNSYDEDGTFFAGPGGEFEELIYTQDSARYHGAELHGHFDWIEVGDSILGLDGQVDFVHARIDSERAPRIPPIRWGAGVFWSGPRLRARVGFLRSMAQRRLAPFETRTSGHTLVDATLAWEILAQGNRSLELHLGARNLLDEKARNHVSFKKEDVLLPGRSLRVALHGRF